MYINEIYCSGDIICEGGLKVKRILSTQGEIPHVGADSHKNRLVKFEAEGESGLVNSNLSSSYTNDSTEVLLTVHDKTVLNLKFESLSSSSLKISGYSNKVVLSLLNSTITADLQGNKVFSGDNSQIEVASTKDIELVSGVWQFTE